MFSRFGLMALILTFAAGCDEEAKASTGGGADYDDSEVLARLDALEAALATMQEAVDANSTAIAAIDLSEISAQVAANEADNSAALASLDERTLEVEAVAASNATNIGDLSILVDALSSLPDQVTANSDAIESNASGRVRIVSDHRLRG